MRPLRRVRWQLILNFRLLILPRLFAPPPLLPLACVAGRRRRRRRTGHHIVDRRGRTSDDTFGPCRYILEGKELDFYVRKMQKKKSKAGTAAAG